jgi:antitoxin (DNA-binding transcriptional repressor) of toxin-antitoxin stability system
MKSVTIRELRQHWPETEKALQSENEMIITRDGQPVAKLIRVQAPQSWQTRWNPDAHRKWLAKLWGGRRVRLVDKHLQADRAERLRKRK